MDLLKAFASKPNWHEVEHPAGAKFHIYPWGHPDGLAAFRRNSLTRDYEKFEGYFMRSLEVDDPKKVRMSDFFERMEEADLAEIGLAAGHVAGWSELSMGEDPVEFSFATTKGLMEKMPQFRLWVIEQAMRIAKAENEKRAEAEEAGNA